MTIFMKADEQNALSYTNLKRKNNFCQITFVVPF